jgi:hypothetical protein
MKRKYLDKAAHLLLKKVAIDIAGIKLAYEKEMVDKEISQEEKTITTKVFIESIFGRTMEAIEAMSILEASDIKYTKKDHKKDRCMEQLFKEVGIKLEILGSDEITVEKNAEPKKEKSNVKIHKASESEGKALTELLDGIVKSLNKLEEIK